MLDRADEAAVHWHVPQRKLKTPLGGELEQIQFLLGQGTVHTTERYLGWKQKIRRPVNGAIALEDA